MRKGPTLVIFSFALACLLWLGMSLSTHQGVPVVAPLQARAQQGVYTITLQHGVSPSGYEGSADTYINMWAETDNKGSDGQLWVKGDGPQRALIKFDLSQHIPQGAQVRSAKLTLHLNSVSGGGTAGDLETGADRCAVVGGGLRRQLEICHSGWRDRRERAIGECRSGTGCRCGAVLGGQPIGQRGNSDSG